MSKLILIAALAGCLPPAHATSPDKQNALLGQWARERAECSRPELSFSPTSARIAMDADGAPIKFSYPKVRYLTQAGTVTIQLGKRHPFAQTPDKTALRFTIVDDDTVALSQSGPAATQFVRCKP